MSSMWRTSPAHARLDRQHVRPPCPADPALIRGTNAGERGMVFCVQFALLVISTNAVIIQTIATDGSPMKNLIRTGVLAVVLFAMIMRRTIVPGWLIILTLSSLILLFLTGNQDQLTIVFVMLLIPGMWSINERVLTRAVLIASLSALLLVFAFLWLGLTTNDLRLSQTLVSADIRARYTFGTASVPFFMNVTYGAAVMAIFYSYRWKLRNRSTVALLVLVGSLWIFTQTDGRGGFLGIIMFCALAWTMPSLVKRWFFRGLLAIQPLIYLAVAGWLASQPGDPQLNELFSFRPLLYRQFLDHVTFWNLLTSTSVKEGEVTTVDNSFLHLLYGAGLVMFIAFCLMFGRSVLSMAQSGRTLELAFLTSTMAYASSESIMLRADNIFILFAWYLIVRYGTGVRNLGGP